MPYLTTDLAAEYIARRSDTVVTAHDLLLSGISGQLVMCAYFGAGEMFSQTDGEVVSFAGGHLVIPPYHLVEIEAEGSATINHAIGLKGGPLLSPLLVRGREQLRVFARHADEFIEVLVAAKQAAKAELGNNAAGIIPSDSNESAAPEEQAPSPSSPSWSLKLPKRYQGYTKSLYDVLKTAHAANDRRPTPNDVLDAFRKRRPLEIFEVMADGFKFYDSNGTPKQADLEAIRKAIGRFTETKT